MRAFLCLCEHVYLQCSNILYACNGMVCFRSKKKIEFIRLQFQNDSLEAEPSWSIRLSLFISQRGSFESSTTKQIKVCAQHFPSVKVVFSSILFSSLFLFFLLQFSSLASTQEKRQQLHRFRTNQIKGKKQIERENFQFTTFWSAGGDK